MQKFYYERGIIMSFLDKLSLYTADSMKDRQKIRIAKDRFLKKNKEDLIDAIKYGYKLRDIVEVANEELLGAELPEKYTISSKEGKDIIKNTKFSGAEIKKFIEN